MPQLPKDATHITLRAVGEIKAGTPVHVIGEFDGGMIRIAKAWTIYGPLELTGAEDLLPIPTPTFEHIRQQFMDLQGWKLKLGTFFFSTVETYVLAENVSGGGVHGTILTGSQITTLVCNLPHPSFLEAFGNQCPK